jgi:hypothetical protein
MPQFSESGCAPDHFDAGVRLGMLRAVGGTETAAQPAQRGPEAASLGYRGHPHPGGTLGCGVGYYPLAGKPGHQ